MRVSHHVRVVLSVPNCGLAWSVSAAHLDEIHKKSSGCTDYSGSRDFGVDQGVRDGAVPIDMAGGRAVGDSLESWGGSGRSCGSGTRIGGRLGDGPIVGREDLPVDSHSIPLAIGGQAAARRAARTAWYCGVRPRTRRGHAGFRGRSRRAGRTIRRPSPRWSWPARGGTRSGPKFGVRRSWSFLRSGEGSGKEDRSEGVRPASLQLCAPPRSAVPACVAPTPRIA